MPVDIKKNQKNLAMDLRSQGYSYGEIQKELAVSKSTLSSWLKNVQLVGHHVKRLKEKRSEVARQNSKKRSAKILLASQELEDEARSNIEKISKRELWLLGVMLYWREAMSNKKSISASKGVSLMSSDPKLVRFFLRWLQEAGRLKKSEILLDIFLSRNTNTIAKTDTEIGPDHAVHMSVRDKSLQEQNAITYWSGVTRFSKDQFTRLYYIASPQKKYLEKEKGKKSNPTKNNFGILRLRVRASSALAHQLNGWVEGIQKVINI